jgi:hypothetical protein
MGAAKPERNLGWLQVLRREAEANAMQQASVAEMRPRSNENTRRGYRRV